MTDHRHDPAGDELEARERADRRLDHAPATGPGIDAALERLEQPPADVVPIRRLELAPAIDVDELERARAAAGPRPIRSPERAIELAGGATATVSYTGPMLEALERDHGLTPAPRLRDEQAIDLALEIQHQRRAMGAVRRDAELSLKRSRRRREEADLEAARRRERRDDFAVAVFALLGAALIVLAFVLAAPGAH